MAATPPTVSTPPSGAAPPCGTPAPATSSAETASTAHPTAADAADEVSADELARRVVGALRLRRRAVRRGVAVALGVLVTVCLVAVVTRASAWPLAPLGPLAVAGYGVSRARAAVRDRPLLAWGAVAAVGTAVGLWSMSFVARTFL